jgi:thiol-disulfide isomerase/thioredoxin
MKLSIFAALTLALVSAAQAQDQKVLLPGDKAPELKVAKYYQGDPIKKFESGKVYVVEFWATWCAPCIEAIPHMSELSKKQKGKAEFIGVNIWDEEEGQDDRIKKFVVDMGDKMSYRVAVDTNEMYMTSKWMEGSFSNGIPTAFIVNQEGKIAWIGHPMDIEEPLQQIIDKKYDIKAARETQAKKVNEEIELSKLYEKLQEGETLYNQGRKEEGLKIIDELAKDDRISTDAKSLKLNFLAKDDVPQAKILIEALAQGTLSEMITVSIFSISNATDKDGYKELALFAANSLVDKMKIDHPVPLYYASPALSMNNDHKKSLVALERALKAFDALPKDQQEQLEGFRPDIEAAIAKEKAAIGG